MIETIREAFEQVSAPNFGHELTFPKNAKGEYVNPTLEDHWQTFQEGWETAVDYFRDYIKQKQNSDYSDKYSDIVSTGGMDPRN